MSLIEIKRNFRSASTISGFIAFAIGLLITQFKMTIPFFNFAYFLPNKIEGVGYWLYEDTIKGFLVPNFSAFLTYFLPIWILVLIYLFKFKKEEEEVFKRGSKIQSSKEVIKAIHKYIKKSKDTHRLELGVEQLPMPENQLVKNTLLVAMPGAGKTQALYSFLVGNVNSKGKKLTNGLANFNDNSINEDMVDFFVNSVAPVNKESKSAHFEE